MCLFHTSDSTFIYFSFIFCLFSFQKPAKLFCSVFRYITTNNNNKQILQGIIEICTKISDVLVFISNLMT